MNEKLNHSDLSTLLAKETKMSGVRAEAFTKALFDVIIEGLEQDGIVKINGLGTFKITDVADRYSINVNTGEKFEIKGHKKISFIPAESLKESVNRPFAMFEPVEVDDTYQEDFDSSVEDAESNEIEETAIPVAEVPVAEEENSNLSIPVDIAEIEEELPQENLSDNVTSTPAIQVIDEEQPIVEECDIHNTTPQYIVTKEELAVEEKESEEKAAATEEPVLETPVINDRDTETLAKETAMEETTSEETVKNDNVKEEIPVKNDDAVESKAAPVKKRKKGLRITIYIIIGFICGYAGVKMLGRDHTSDEKGADVAQSSIATPEPIAKIKEEQALVIRNIVDSVATAKPEIPADTIPASDEVEENDNYTFIMNDELATRSDRSITDADTTLYVLSGELAVHVVAENERLAKISNDYYGSRKLWPYIAKYNNLKEPYGITVGMKLVIPELRQK